MGKRVRLGIVLLLFGCAVGAGVYGAMSFLRHQPPNVNFVTGHRAGQPVRLVLQEVGALGSGAHPAWVSYLVRAPDGHWVHSTQWELPAHTRIDVTDYQFDSGSPLRNQSFGLVAGTVGDTYRLNGKTVHLLNSNTGNGVGHTFTVPRMGINVPLWGVASSAKNFCSVPAPCPLSTAHNTITFSFVTGAPGQYHWQCLIPCGVGYLNGNGGPMQTLGYMAGFLKVLPS